MNLYDRAANLSDVFNRVEDEVGVEAALELLEAENEDEFHEFAQAALKGGA